MVFTLSFDPEKHYSHKTISAKTKPKQQEHMCDLCYAIFPDIW